MNQPLRCMTLPHNRLQTSSFGFVCVAAESRTWPSMKPSKVYVSPDNQLRFVVAHDEQDVSLGFEGFPWHTHAEVLASEFGTSEELAVNRFVRDLLSDRSIVAVSRIGGQLRDDLATTRTRIGI